MSCVKIKIREIKLGMSNISTEGKIIKKSEAKKVKTRYGIKRVSNAILKDETAEITVVLWEEQIDLIDEGDFVEIENGYATQWKGKLQLNIPKRGNIKVKKVD